MQSPNFTKTVLIRRGNSLSVKSPGMDDLGFAVKGGTLQIPNTASLKLDGDGTKALYNGGQIVSDGQLNAGGSIWIFNGTSLTIQENAANLGAWLPIGQSPTGVDSASTVNIASADGGTGLAGNLTLVNSATIYVYPKGFLDLAQARLTQRPEHLHDLQLTLGQVFRGFSCHV